MEQGGNRSIAPDCPSYGSGCAPKGLEVGMTVTAGENAPFSVGTSLPLWRIPLGTLVHNIELKPGRGGQMAGRSSGMGG